MTINKTPLFSVKILGASLLLIINIQTSYANSEAEFNVKVDDKEVLSVNDQVSLASNQLPENDLSLSSHRLEFKKPDSKQLELTNNSDKDITLKGIYFAEENTCFKITKSHNVTIDGIANCTKISAGKSCALTINATKNASPSYMYRDGQPFYINYTASEESESKIIDFTVKIDYNHNLLFDKQSSQFFIHDCHHPLTQELVIKNNNLLQPITITKILLATNTTNIEIGDYSKCSHLKNGESCKVSITVFPDSANTILPINTIYHFDNADDGQNMVATNNIMILNYYSDNYQPPINEQNLIGKMYRIVKYYLGEAYEDFSGILNPNDIDVKTAFKAGAIKEFCKTITKSTINIQQHLAIFGIIIQPNLLDSFSEVLLLDLTVEYFITLCSRVEEIFNPLNHRYVSSNIVNQAIESFGKTTVSVFYKKLSNQDFNFISEFTCTFMSDLTRKMTKWIIIKAGGAAYDHYAGPIVKRATKISCEVFIFHDHFRGMVDLATLISKDAIFERTIYYKNQKKQSNQK